MHDTAMRRLIAAKRDGAELAPADWESIVGRYLGGVVDDAQLAALLMACVLRGMSFRETLALTRAFVASGDVLASAAVAALDKHSTGGVGDTATLAVVPLVAACGVPMAKLSGRALGHTGGTLDKLEAVPGVRTDLSPERFAACVRDAGCAIAAQSDRFVPADKRMYALRDRTATVPAPGLIAASIVAKKIAGGASAIVYDVKAGRGAFLPDARAAYDLADLLVALTEALGRPARALVTDMNEPLGPAIGTGLEAIAARDYLHGEAPGGRLDTVVRALASALLRLAGHPEASIDATLQRALDSGAAYERLEAMLSAQGARPGALTSLRPHAEATAIRAAHAGFVAAVDPVSLGEAARDLVESSGAGAGIVLGVRGGDVVERGATLAMVYGDASASHTYALQAAFTVSGASPPPRPIVYRESGSRERVAIATSFSAAFPRSTLESR